MLTKEHGIERRTVRKYKQLKELFCYEFSTFSVENLDFDDVSLSFIICFFGLSIAFVLFLFEKIIDRYM